LYPKSAFWSPTVWLVIGMKS